MCQLLTEAFSYWKETGFWDFKSTVCMGVIIDANRAALAVNTPPDPALRHVVDWITTKGCLVVGGKLREELAKIAKFNVWMTQLKRAGRLEEINDAEVNATAERLAAEPKLLKSNDAHVVALALVSGVRVICTEDELLTQDINNAKVLKKPRGKVFRDHKIHAALLTNAPKCERCNKRT